MLHAGRFLSLTSLLASILALPAASQQIDGSSLNARSCLNDDGWDSSPSASSVKTVVECLIAKIDTLEAEVRPFRQAQGAVLAFDRSEKNGACPRGWTLFHEAGGRAIIGAGEHRNSGVSNYPSYSDNPNTSIGGLETVTLSPAQLPPHEHNLGEYAGGSVNQGIGGGPYTYLFPHGSLGEAALGHYRSADSDGLLASPVNNMPPFIALYFCRRE